MLVRHLPVPIVGRAPSSTLRFLTSSIQSSGVVSSPESGGFLYFRQYHRAPNFTLTSRVIPGNLPRCSACLQLEGRRYLFKDPDEHKEFVTARKKEFLRTRDGLPKSYELIYRSDFATYIVAVQVVLFLGIGAIITTFIMQLYLSSLSEEEKAERIRVLKEQRDKRQQELKESKLEKSIQEFRGDNVSFAVTPHPDDIYVDFGLDYEEFLCVTFATICLSLAIFKLQRMIPVRIYMNKKDHCVAVKFGHILPGVRTYHEFLAGSVKPIDKWMNLHAGNCYRDAAGNYMIFVPRFFRQPADYNKILGYEEDFAEEAVKRKVRTNTRDE